MAALEKSSHLPTQHGSVTFTIENGATTLCHMNLSGYVGHVICLVECSLLRAV